MSPAQYGAALILGMATAQCYSHPCDQQGNSTESDAASVTNNDDGKEKTFVEWLDSVIDVRQGIESKEQLQKAAAIQYVSPASGEDSHQFDVGLKFKRFLGNDNPFGMCRTTYSVFYEVHRNTEIEKEQNTHVGGLVWSLDFGAEPTDGYGYVLDIKAGYKADHEADGEGGTIKVAMTGWNAEKGIGSSAIRNWAGQEFWFGWQIFAGVYYEDMDGTSEAGIDGDATRAYTALLAQFNPPGSNADGPWELSVTQSYWAMLNDDDAFESVYGKDQAYLESSLSYFFDEEQRFSIALSYINGENPEAGKLDQETTALAFRFKL